MLEIREEEQREFYALASCETSETKYEGGDRSTSVDEFTRDLAEKIFCCRSLHRKFTIHPQVFHTPSRFRFGVNRPVGETALDSAAFGKLR